MSKKALREGSSYYVRLEDVGEQAEGEMKRGGGLGRVNRKKVST